MGKIDFNKLITAIESRKLQERALLLGALVILIGYGWLVLVWDGLGAEQQQLNNRITILTGQVVEEANRYVEIQRNYSNDPNAFVRNRQQELQRQSDEVDERLGELYGQLVQPREMAEVLTTVLQKETTLRLVSLKNQPSSMLTSASAGAAASFAGATNEIGESIVGENGLQVYRHGLEMTFEGDYIETIRYLRSLENLDTSFFWETMNYEVSAWPVARITLNIFTLSTQAEWIGV